VKVLKNETINHKIAMGKRIGELMTSVNLTHEGLARKIGHHYTRQAIAKWVNGENSPRNEQLRMLSEIFGVTTDYLLGNKPPPPIVHSKSLPAHPYEWMRTGTNEDGFCIYNSSTDPNYRIEYGRSKEVLFPDHPAGQFKVIIEDRYWMSNFNIHRGSDEEYKFRLLYNGERLREKDWVVINTFKTNYQRVLWPQKVLFLDSFDTPIRYSYIEKDSVEWYIDLWLFNVGKDRDLEDETHYRCPTELWRIDPYYFRGDSNPYNLVLIFDNATERREFVAYVKSHKDDFLATLGNFNRSSESDWCALFECPEYMEYLCKSSKLLIEWFDKYKLSKKMAV